MCSLLAEPEADIMNHKSIDIYSMLLLSTTQ